MTGRQLAGFILSRLAGGRSGNPLGRGRRARRGRGLARALLNLHLRRLAGLGARAVFLEVDEDNEPARSGSIDRAGFARVSAAARLLSAAPAARPPPRWCCAAIWCVNRRNGPIAVIMRCNTP